MMIKDLQIKNIVNLTYFFKKIKFLFMQITEVFTNLQVTERQNICFEIIKMSKIQDKIFTDMLARLSMEKNDKLLR